LSRVTLLAVIIGACALSLAISFPRSAFCDQPLKAKLWLFRFSQFPLFFLRFL
jgi:hypothetical protein